MDLCIKDTIKMLVIRGRNCISMVIIIVFYEFFDYFTKRSYKFDISKLYSKEIVGYTVTVALIFFFFINENYLLRVAQYFGLYDWLAMYYLVINPGIPYSGILFNWFTYLILLSLWFRRKKYLMWMYLLPSSIFFLSYF